MYKYVINIEKIAFWLNVRKDHLKTLLKSNFTIDEDYIILKYVNSKENGKGKAKVKIIGKI